MKMEVLKDTKIIEDNTADSLQVKMLNDEVIAETEYEANNGTIIKGDNLIVTTVSYANQGNLKLELEDIDQKIAQLQARKIEIQNLLLVVTPEIDKAIDEILLEEGSEDRRTPKPIGEETIK